MDLNSKHANSTTKRYATTSHQKATSATTRARALPLLCISTAHSEMTIGTGRTAFRVSLLRSLPPIIFLPFLLSPSRIVIFDNSLLLAPADVVSFQS